MSVSLGVDLGTTFTAAAVSRDGQLDMATLGDHTAAIPSVVMTREDGTTLTGDAANRRAASDPSRVAREVKRRLGDPTPLILGGEPWSAAQVLSRLLSSVVAAVGAREGGRPDRIVLTHPANWGPYKRELFDSVPRLADLPAVSMITEPEAAAAHYASNARVAEGSVVAVYDLGGGTFDATVLRKLDQGFEFLGPPEGVEGLGGIDFDEAVFAHVDRALDGALGELDLDDHQTASGLVRLRQECVLAKEALSADTEASVSVLLPGLHTDVRVTRAEFEEMIRPPIESTMSALRRALTAANVEPEDISNVLLVGGSSRIPLVSQALSAALGRPTSVDTHPKHAVALGAALMAQTATARSATQNAAKPTAGGPSAAGLGTAGASAAGLGAAGPGAAGAKAAGPNAAGPNAAGPNAAGPNAAGPNAAGPNAAGPNADVPSAGSDDRPVASPPPARSAAVALPSSSPRTPAGDDEMATPPHGIPMNYGAGASRPPAALATPHPAGGSETAVTSAVVATRGGSTGPSGAAQNAAPTGAPPRQRTAPHGTPPHGTPPPGSPPPPPPGQARSTGYQGDGRPPPSTGAGAPPPALGTTWREQRKSGQPSGGAGFPRRRIVTLIVIAAVIVAAAGVYTVVSRSTQTPVYQKTASAGPNPFMAAIGTDDPTMTPVANAGGSRPADLPGLYATDPNRPVCDANALVANLSADSAKARTWAEILGISATDVPTYVDGLTPVLLRSDTAVVDHGYLGDGKYSTVPAVLATGTAVFITKNGQPVVKCYNGDPLTQGESSDARVTVIKPSSKGPTTYVDPHNKRPVPPPPKPPTNHPTGSTTPPTPPPPTTGAATTGTPSTTGGTTTGETTTGGTTGGGTTGGATGGATGGGSTGGTTTGGSGTGGSGTGGGGSGSGSGN